METVFRSDSLIFVMGVTGSGKSSFIADLLSESDLENEAVGIGHDLESCTASVGFFALDLRPGTRVFLVDTPGFDDTYRSDGEILREIAYIMAQTHRAGLRLAGVVYLHRITDNRLQGSAARNLRMLERLIGEQAFPAVVFATSMWDDVLSGPAGGRVAAEERESQLVGSDYGCARLVAGGARIARWMRGDGQSAAAIVNGLVDRVAADTSSGQGITNLLIQKEIVDEEKELDNTEAGSFLVTDLETRLHDEFSEFRGSIRAEIEGLRVGFRGLLAKKQQAYQETLSRITAEQKRVQRELDNLQAAQERLVQEDSRNVQAFYQLQGELGAGGNTLSEEDRDELQSQFDEQQALSRDRRQGIDDKLRKKKKRELLKENVVPLLQILAGIGMIVVGGVTANMALFAPGTTKLVGGIKSLRFSKKQGEKQDEQGGQDVPENEDGEQNQVDYSLIDL